MLQEIKILKQVAAELEFAQYARNKLEDYRCTVEESAAEILDRVLLDYSYFKAVELETKYNAR
jgi:hypothetical protein